MDATITVTGNVGSDIDLRSDDTNEWAYAAFRLACTPRQFRSGGWRDGETIWLNVNCRNKALSLNVRASIGRGDPVIVSGRLSTWSWVNKETGVVNERLVLEALTVGHDLTRGTSSFRRAERATVEPPAPEESDPFGELAGEGEGSTGDDTPDVAEAAA